MRVAFPSLQSAHARSASEGVVLRIAERLRILTARLRGAPFASGATLDEPFAYLEFDGEGFLLRDYAAEAAPCLRRAAEELLPEVRVAIGLAVEPLERALERVFRETGVRLEGTRVRVGVVRGHMFEISWHVPLDITGDAEDVEDAADLLCEALLGTRDYHSWVRSNHVVRSARRGGIRVFSGEDGPELHSLEEARALLAHSIELVEAERSFVPELAQLGWTVFEHAATEALDAPQATRVFTATRCPEATKCFLEGAHFSSSRFLRAQALFLSVKVELLGERRAEMRKECEALVQSARGCVLVGTGFSAREDYFDVALETPALIPELIAELREALATLACAVELEFWDSELRLESFSLAPR